MEVTSRITRTAQFNETEVVFEEGKNGNLEDSQLTISQMRPQGAEMMEFSGDAIGLLQEALKRVLPAQGGFVIHPATNSQGQAIR